MRQRNFKEAIALRQRASQLAHAHSDADAEKTLEYDNNLAVTWVLAGEPKEAVPLLRSVADRRRKLNPRHPELATALANLGGTLVGLGRFAEAETVLQDAIGRQTGIRGKTAGATLDARSLFAYALEGQEQWDQAEKNYLSLLADRREFEGQPNQDPRGIQRTLAYLARLYGKQNRWSDAARYLAELNLSVHPDASRKFEALTPALTAALEGTAIPAAAEPLLRECWEDVKLRTWVGDWFAAEVASRYGDCLRRGGREKYKEAEPVLVSAANDIAKAVGVPAWGMAASRRRVADLYDAWKKPAEAAKWR